MPDEDPADAEDTVQDACVRMLTVDTLDLSTAQVWLLTLVRPRRSRRPARNQGVRLKSPLTESISDQELATSYPAFWTSKKHSVLNFQPATSVTISPLTNAGS